MFRMSLTRKSSFPAWSMNSLTADFRCICSRNWVLSVGSWLSGFIPLFEVIIMLSYEHPSFNLLRSILNSSFLLTISSSALSKQRRNRFVCWLLCFCFFIGYSTLPLKKSMMKAIKSLYVHVLCVSSTRSFWLSLRALNS